MKHRRTRFIPVACAACALTLAVVADAAADTRTSSVPNCRTAGLAIRLEKHGSGTAGSAFYMLAFTNASRRQCALRGYPGVSAVDRAGRRLGLPAARGTRTVARTIVLARGRTARAVLQVNDVDVFPATACRPVRAAGLRVFPPNETVSKVIPLAFRACSRTARTFLHVDAVARS